MTSVALILGLVPTALSNSAGAESRAAMAVVTIGGMATSTVLTLLVVPVVYVLVDSLIERTQNVRARLRARFGRRGAKRAAAPSEPFDTLN
jgi:HAE1 family hydrophobic/amphiphilic exporter-1